MLGEDNGVGICWFGPQWVRKGGVHAGHLHHTPPRREAVSESAEMVASFAIPKDISSGLGAGIRRRTCGDEGESRSISKSSLDNTSPRSELASKEQDRKRMTDGLNFSFH